MVQSLLKMVSHQVELREKDIKSIFPFAIYIAIMCSMLLNWVSFFNVLLPIAGLVLCLLLLVIMATGIFFLLNMKLIFSGMAARKIVFSIFVIFLFLSVVFYFALLRFMPQYTIISLLIKFLGFVVIFVILPFVLAIWGMSPDSQTQ